MDQYPSGTSGICPHTMSLLEEVEYGREKLIKDLEEQQNSQTSDYSLDAALAGGIASGSLGNNHLVGGVESIYLINDRTVGAYDYIGESVDSTGIGGSLSAYLGFVFNLEDLEDYEGHFAVIGFTYSVGNAGVTGFYFWNPTTDRPLTPGNTQGFGIGYAPGAQASIWYENVFYDLFWSSN